MTPPIVKRYLIALNQYWFAIPAGFLLGISGGFVFAEVMQKPASTTYSIEGVLQYTRPPITFSETSTSIQQQGQLLTEDQSILLAPDVIEAAAKRPGVKDDARTISRKVRVRVPKRVRGELESNQVKVQYSSEKADDGAVVVAALMEEMVAHSARLNKLRLGTIIEGINQRLPGITQELRTAEQRLQDFIRREQTVLLAIQAGQLPGAIASTEQQQRQIELALEGLDAQMQSIQNQLGLDPTQAYASAALSADPIIADLRAKIYQNETQLQILTKDLRPEHPTVVTLRQQQQSLEQLLQARAAEVIGGGGQLAPLQGADTIRRDSSLDPARQQLAQSLVALKSQRQALAQQLEAAIRSEAELRRQYAVLPNKQIEQSRIEQQIVLKKAFYDAMQSKLLDARTAEAETVSSLAIAAPPAISDEVKTAPLPTPLLLVGGGLGGLIAGAAAVFLLGSLGGVLQTMEDIRDFLKERETQLLGVLPLVDVYDPGFGGEDPVILSPYSPYLEYYERFRSNLRQIEGGKSLKVVLMTSIVKGEGKTVSAYNLAIASARAGKRTLLIEGDLRSPSMAKAVKVASDPANNLEPLLYYGQLSECIRFVPDVENLYIVPSLKPQHEAAALIESMEIKRLLEDARTRFDFVVVDSSTLSLCNDALLLEPFTDGIILVTRPRLTGGNLLAEAIEQLGDSEEFRLLGVVINADEIPVKVSTLPKTEVTPEVAQPEPEPTPKSKSKSKKPGFVKTRS